MESNVVILGAGGFAREVYWHVKAAWPSANMVFADDISDTEKLDMVDGPVPVVKDWIFDGADLAGAARCEEFVVGVGDPNAKKVMVKKALDSGLRPAATVVHPAALIQGRDCPVGRGGVIAPGCVITTNVTIGDFVILNLNTTVGHDTVIEDYVTCNPGCQISGNVRLGAGCNLGTGTIVREEIRIAANVVVGAQAAVVKSVDQPGITVAGVPAKALR